MSDQSEITAIEDGSGLPDSAPAIDAVPSQPFSNPDEAPQAENEVPAVDDGRAQSDATEETASTQDAAEDAALRTPEEPGECVISAASILERPELVLDTLRGSLWQVAADDSIAVDSSDAGRFVASVRAEAQSYQERLSHQRDFLAARMDNQLSDFASQDGELRSQFELMCTEIEKQIDEFMMRPHRSRPARFSTSKGGTPAAVVEADSAEAVIKFWKTKYAQVVEAIESTADEHSSIRSRTDDLKQLQSKDHFRAVRLLGELRSEESQTLEDANGIQHLLMQLQEASSGTVSPRTSREPASSDKERSTRDRFSIIEKRIVEAEEEALKLMQAAVDGRIRSLRSLLNTLSFRNDSLDGRADEIATQTSRAHSASLDKTLQLAMDLRSKVVNDAVEAEDAHAEVVDQHHRDEANLRSEIESYVRRAAEEEAAMTREMRERRVKVIRTIHSSGGNVDARFEHVRAQQHVSAIGQQVSAAESDRVNLKLRLAAASGQAQRNLDFLSQC